MNVKKHQEKPLRNDMRQGVILSSLLLFAFALSIIKINISVGLTILSFTAVILFFIPYILMVNPTLIKVLRQTHFDQSRIHFFALGVLFLSLQLYALFSGQFQYTFFIITLLWIAGSGILITFYYKSEQTFLLGLLMVLWLWLPIEFGIFTTVTIPPIQSLLQPTTYIGLLMLIYTFAVIARFDMGLTFRLKGDEWRIIILQFLVLFFICMILALPLGAISLTKRMPEFLDMLIKLITIFFLTALPEEILFRGVFYRLILGKFQGRKYAVGKAMVLSSVLFGLAHANNKMLPLMDIHLGQMTWQLPWALILLSTVTGFFYCFVFIRTKKVTAAAVLHLLVNWVFVVFFN